MPKNAKTKKKLTVTGIILGLLLIAVGIFLLVVFVSPIYSGNNIHYGTFKDPIASKNWMSYLADSTYLQDVNIPGTHDAGTRFSELAYFSKCQATDIETQLNNGYRYLDIRLAVDKTLGNNPRLKFMHGFTNCKVGHKKNAQFLYLDSVLEQCYRFLEENPSETVIFCVKQEHGKESVPEFQEVLDSYIQKNPDRWYTQNDIPQLGELRGKLFLARRYNNEAELPNNAGFNLVWAEQGNREIAPIPYELNPQENGIDLIVEDRFTYNADDKWEAFTASVQFTNKHRKDATIYLNFLSTKGNTTFGHPLKYAKPLNKKLWNVLFAPDTKTGWIIIDYGTVELAQKIYMTNF